MKSKKILSVLLCVFLLAGTAFTGCFGGKVSLSPTAFTMKVGETAIIIPEVEGFEGELAWKSSDISVVMVTDGNVMALKVGSAVITVFAGNASATCEVTVEPNGEYTVIFDYQAEVDGEPATTMTVGYGTQFVFPQPVRSGYDFVGWFDGTDDTSKKLTDNRGISIAGWNIASETDITVYAVWTLPEYSPGLVYKWNKLNAGWEVVSGGANVGSYKVIDGEVKEVYIKSAEHIRIPSYYMDEKVVAISAGAFQNCIDTVSIELSSQLVTIGANAFENCFSLEDIGGNLPVGLSTIGLAAFKNCKSLDFGGGLPAGLSGVSGIAANAFENCESLTIDLDFTVTGITQVTASSFAGCKSVSSIKIGSKVTSLGANAFNGCSAATVIDIKEYGGSGLANYAFKDCTSITEIYIPDKVKNFVSYQGVFEGCTSLDKITFGTSFGENYSANLFHTTHAFKGSSIKTFEVAEGNKVLTVVDNVLFATYRADDQLESNQVGAGTNLLWYPCGSDTTSYEVPEGTLFIYRSAFDGAVNLQTLTLPASMASTPEAIRGYSILNCPKLTTVYLKNAGTSPSDITALATNNFGGCPSFAHVYVENEASLAHYQGSANWGSATYAAATGVTIDLAAKLAVK